MNNIGIVDEAQLPDTPYNINHIKDMFMFVCMGIVVSFAYVVIIYLFDNTIKKEEDIEKWTERIKTQNEASYLNLPMNKEEYEKFWNDLVNAEVVTLHDFEKKEIFEGCMPIEIMAKRGIDTLRFGPLKPVGFTDPRTGYRPYAIVQLR